MHCFKIESHQPVQSVELGTKPRIGLVKIGKIDKKPVKIGLN